MNHYRTPRPRHCCLLLVGAALALVGCGQRDADGIRPRLTVALLNGDLALVGVSGEFFCNHSIRLKEWARVKQFLFFGYCNGYHQHFPTIEAVAEGGYGADATVSPVEVGTGEKMMNTALTWIYQMQGKIK